MKKSITAIAIVVLIIVGCSTVRIDPPQPNAAGCVLTAQALGNTIVASLSWTNPSNFHHGIGMTIYPESGSMLSEIADPSVACLTNSTTSVALSLVCHGTNMPNAILLALPPNSSGFSCTVTFDCNTCRFGSSSPSGYSCSPINKPAK